MAGGLKEVASRQDMSFASWKLFSIVKSEFSSSIFFFFFLIYRGGFLLTSGAEANGGAQRNGKENRGGRILEHGRRQCDGGDVGGHFFLSVQ